MTQPLMPGNTGTPILLMREEDYSDWHEQQSETVRNWLAANAYEGKGSFLLSDTSGQLSSVVYIPQDMESFFIAGDLPVNLPAGQYTLDTSFFSAKPSDLVERFAVSWGLASYRFERYIEAGKALPVLVIADQQQLKRAEHVVSAVCYTRDLINTPASDMMPEQLAESVAAMADEYGASVEQISGQDLLTQNFPMIHAVGRASCHEPRLLDLHWGNEDHPKITLVGKGVCFDSGGLNLKPGNFMRQMKKDMGGAAHVLGLARLIMAERLPVRLRVLVPAVENAVSGNAFRPGDVLPTRKGLTVEIDNTDAEGRLVLCDALTLAESDKPDLIVDFATLTGACRVALGTELPGFFCNSDDVAHELFSAAHKVADPVWQLPLHKPYQDMLKSDIADTLNCSAGGFGGAITAALYLQRFVDDSNPWIHFDVMAWNNRKLPGRPVGGEAFGLRAVYEMLESRYRSE